MKMSQYEGAREYEYYKESIRKELKDTKNYIEENADSPKGIFHFTGYYVEHDRVDNYQDKIDAANWFPNKLRENMKENVRLNRLAKEEKTYEVVYRLGKMEDVYYEQVAARDIFGRFISI